MQPTPHARPPKILQIHREALKEDGGQAYGAIEADTARICKTLGCPHPYLAIESLAGTKEVWFLNGYESPDEQKKVAAAYAKNSRLMKALMKNSQRKTALTETPLNLFANYRPDLSGGAPWFIGQGRFLTIAASKVRPQIDGTAFEATDGFLFIVVAAHTRSEAESAAACDPQSRIFAVRPWWSFPAAAWRAADPDFWRPKPPGDLG